MIRPATTETTASSETAASLAGHYPGTQREILRAIRLVAGGEAMLSPAITRKLIEHVGGAETGAGDRRGRARERLETLSDREREVALAVGAGKSNAEIATELYMSVATVKAHVSRLLTKLDLNNRVQIALLVHDAQG